MSTPLLFQEELVDHFKYPRNKGLIASPDFFAGLDNPSCGDKIMITGILHNGIIEKLGFEGSGCVISQATTSMLTELCIGKTPAQALALTKDDILNMIGITLGPTRLKCALLSLDVLHEALHAKKQ